MSDGIEYSIVRVKAGRKRDLFIQLTFLKELKSTLMVAKFSNYYI